MYIYILYTPVKPLCRGLGQRHTAHSHEDTWLFGIIRPIPLALQAPKKVALLFISLLLFFVFVTLVLSIFLSTDSVRDA